MSADQAAPATMRAAYARARGGPEVITVGDLPVPRPGPGEVLVAVAAAPVNHVDRLVLSGDYDTAWADPMVIGRDAAGTVAAEAPGTAAGHVAVPATRLYRLPGGVDPITAAATIHPAMTAWLGLVREGGLTVGQIVVIEGASGAVGSAALQTAVAAGAEVVVTCSAADADWCTGLCARAAVDYRDPELGARLSALLPGGADLWWDQSGRNDFALSAARLRRGGRIIVSAGLGGAAPTLPVGALYTRDGSVRGFAISAARPPILSRRRGRCPRCGPRAVCGCARRGSGIWPSPPRRTGRWRALAGGAKQRQVLVP